jgi:predicted 2-oxoglutarate/Fe(II)-dependent dioxygenase YbiX
MNELKDYIIVLDNIMPEKLCNDILNEYENSNEWIDTMVGKGHNQGYHVNKEFRNCTTIEMSSNKVIEKNKHVRKILDDEVFQSTKKAIEKYNEKFKQAHVFKDIGYQLLKYEKGGFYLQHVDSFIESPRTISCSFTLNDNFKGGEFSFFNNTLVYPLKKGSAIMFPSNFLYPHSVLPVINGTRYSIVTWFI